MSKGFSFGANTAASSTATPVCLGFTFGQTTTQSGSTGFNFGATATTKPSNTVNFGGFGAKPATTGTSLFGGGTGFGAAKTTGSNLFGGTATGFGAAKTTTAGTNLFGGSSTGTNLFGGTSTVFSGFGKPATSSTTSAFGTGLNFGKPSLGGTAATGFGAPALQQNAQQQQPSQDTKAMELLATASSLSSPVLYGDERDLIITKWNQLQAFWGTGRGFYRKDGSNIPYTPHNYFCRFKAVGYSLLPTTKDSLGLISLVCNKTIDEMRAAGETKLCEAVHRVMGAQPSLAVKLESLRALPDRKSELTVYVREQSSVTGAVRRVLASELHAFLQQPNIREQLKRELAMERCVARVAMTPEQIDAVLATPPAGIDPVIWEQAKLDNPDPKTIITVPMVGFSELRSRLQHQELMAKQHQTRLDILSKGLEELQQQQTTSQSMIDAHRRKVLELSHRLLQVIIMQEIVRRGGFAIEPEEEQLKVQLEKFVNEMNAPTKYRGRLNELLSQARMQQPSPVQPAKASLDDESLQEIGKHLRKQQEGLNALVLILKHDHDDLKLIEKHLANDPAPQHAPNIYQSAYYNR